MLTLSVAILLAGLLYVAGATYRVRWLQLLLKPGTMLLIILLAVIGRVHSPAPLFADLVLVALACSIVGDVLLLPEPPRLIGGTAAFGAAHLAYMAAFAAAGAARLTPAHAVIGLVVASVLLRYCLEMAPAIQQSGQGNLLGGVLLYAGLITLMLWLALGTLVTPGPLPFRPWLVATAAVLFYLSDGILGYCHFVRPWRWRDVAVMLPYFAAQYLFAAAVAFPPK